MKAMILAAGFGTRLFPLTIDRTKPAIPFLGKPLVGYVAEYIAKYGFSDVVVNLHHQPESVKESLGNGSEFGVKINYTLESPEILGTAGALDNAREFLENETFLIINGKIITDIDISKAIEVHKKSGAVATMILKKNPEFEKFTEVLIEDNLVKSFGHGFPEKTADRVSRSDFPLMFTGIHILEPRVFEYIPRNQYSDIVPTFYRPAIAKGEKIVAHIAEGKWFELSTIPRYLDISLQMLNGAKERLIIGKNSTIAESANVSDSVIWDNVTINENARIYRSIIGDGVIIGKNEVYENSAIVRAEMLENHPEIPQKALKGKFIGENYVVSLNQ